MQQGPDAKGGATAAANGNPDALPGANFGPKYEAHVSEMQNKLDEASKRYTAHWVLPCGPVMQPFPGNQRCGAQPFRGVITFTRKGIVE